MFIRNMRSRLDLLKPSIEDKVSDKQNIQHDRINISREFEVGENVLFRDFNDRDTLKRGKIIERVAPLT